MKNDYKSISKLLFIRSAYLRSFQLLSFLLVIFLCFTESVKAQIALDNEQQNITINVGTIVDDLQNAPKSNLPSESSFLIRLPYDGSVEKEFRITENDLLSEQVQKAYPDIRSYSVQMVEDPSIVGDVTISPNGFFAHYLVDGLVIGIYPEDLTNPVNHLVEIGVEEEHYEEGANHFSCNVTTAAQPQMQEREKSSSRSSGNFSYTDPTTGEVLKRKYDLVVAASGEFTTANGGTTASAMEWRPVYSLILLPIHSHRLGVIGQHKLQMQLGGVQQYLMMLVMYFTILILPSMVVLQVGQAEVWLRLMQYVMIG